MRAFGSQLHDVWAFWWCAGLKAESKLATLVTRSMQEKDNGSIELLLVLDSILQVRAKMCPAPVSMQHHAALNQQTLRRSRH